VRLAAKQLKKIGQLAELAGVNRSTILRELIDLGLNRGQVLLATGDGLEPPPHQPVLQFKGSAFARHR
jgi:hypothetical protein